jgi:hypothetical protein
MVVVGCGTTATPGATGTGAGVVVMTDVLGHPVTIGEVVTTRGATTTGAGVVTTVVLPQINSLPAETTPCTIPVAAAAGTPTMAVARSVKRPGRSMTTVCAWATLTTTTAKATIARMVFFIDEKFLSGCWF